MAPLLSSCNSDELSAPLGGRPTAPLHVEARPTQFSTTPKCPTSPLFFLTTVLATYRPMSLI